MLFVLLSFAIDKDRSPERKILRFCVNFVGARVSSESPNLKSAQLERPDITRAKLRQECDAGRIVDPFSTPPFLNFRCSPLGLVPKKEPSEFRMIHHLSYPKGSSVNDFIPDYCSTSKYASVGDAIKLLKRLGHGCFMAKTDVKSSFRITPFHSADFSLLGMRWDNMYYFDRCLAMGLSTSCAIFESFNTALEWLSINHLGTCAVVHILDDFLFIAKSKEKCVGDLQTIITMCNHLGVPLAPEKTERCGLWRNFVAPLLSVTYELLLYRSLCGDSVTFGRPDLTNTVVCVNN